jgi:hypothetical protein
MRYVCVFVGFYAFLCASQSKSGSIVKAFETLLNDTDDKESLVMVGWHGMTIYPIHIHTSYFWPSNGIFLGGWTMMIIHSNQLYCSPLCTRVLIVKTGRCGEIHRWGHAGRRLLYDTKLGETATTQMAIVQSRKMIEEVTSGQTDSRVSGSF